MLAQTCTRPHRRLVRCISTLLWLRLVCNRCDKRRSTLYRWVVVDVMVSTPTNRDACKSRSKLLSEMRKEFPLRQENGWTSNLYNCEALNIFFLGLCKRSKCMVVHPCACLYRAESVELPCVWINTQQPCHGGWWGGRVEREEEVRKMKEYYTNYFL